MTQSSQSRNGHDPVLGPFVDLWGKLLEQGMEPTRLVLEGAREAFDPAALRRRWLDALAQSLDAYMRSPAFLEAMRRGFLPMTEFKSRAEDLAQEVARETGVPRMPDVSGLFERLQIGQEAILARLGAIEHRLAALEGWHPPEESTPAPARGKGGRHGHRGGRDARAPEETDD
jgi:hypothetical protein